MGVQATFSSARGPIVQENATATGNGIALNMQGSRQISWDVVMSGTVSAGTAVVECIPNILNPLTYAGAWHNLDTIDLTLLSGGGVYHGTFPGNVEWVRIRITVAVAGGGQMDFALLNGLKG